MLGDAARLPGRDLRGTDVVEEGRLAVVDVAHDGDHGWTGHGRVLPFVARLQDLFLDGAFLDRLRDVAELLDDDHRGVLIDDLVDGHHHAEPHQRLDEFGGLDRHLLRELPHRDRLGDGDLADHRRGRHLEGVARGLGTDHRARLLLLAPAARLAARDVQLFAAPPSPVAPAAALAAISPLRIGTARGRRLLGRRRLDRRRRARRRRRRPVRRTRARRRPARAPARARAPRPERASSSQARSACVASPPSPGPRPPPATSRRAPAGGVSPLPAARAWRRPCAPWRRSPCRAARRARSRRAARPPARMRAAPASRPSPSCGGPAARRSSARSWTCAAG